MKQFETFGKYLLLERLAAGGMAEVYLAKSNGAGGVAKFVAIKRILPQFSENQQFIDMFKEEAKIAVNLSHGNVVSIYEFGVENRQFFLVMELVNGQNLRQVLNHIKKENKDFSIDQIVYIIKQVAAGLDHAHRCLDSSTGKPLNITHRDMSPQNIMISFEGEVKVVDFGIAKAESQMEHTQVGTIKGKFGYMSPEQAEGHLVDSRTDIFSLGIILWELLGRDRLFAATNEAATLRKIRDCQIPSLRRLNPAIPAELERICNKALSKDLSLRYQSAADIHRDLNRFLNTQYPDFSPQDFSKFMKSSFANMFLEYRKKQVEYAKAQAPSLDERTIVTTTQTLTSTQTEGAPIEQEEDSKEHLPSLSINIQKQDHINLNSLRTGDEPRSKFTKMTNSMPTAQTNSYARSGVFPPPPPHPAHMQQTSVVYQDKTPNYLLWAVILLMPAAGWFFFKKDIANLLDLNFSSQLQNLAALPQPTTTPTGKVVTSIEQASTQAGQTYTVTIESTPRIARLYIDGMDTAQYTPVRRQFPAGKEVKIGLASEGYAYYEKIERITQNGTSIRATLERLPPMGYVSISSPNSGLDPVVYINNQRVYQKLPILLYGIPSDRPTKIRISNPFVQASGETVVSVGANQKKEVSISLLPDRK